MAHAQKPDFVFRRNGRVHLNRRGRQFSRLLEAEVCASAVVMLDTSCSEVVWMVMITHSIRQFPLHFHSRASPCAITFQLESNVRLCTTIPQLIQPRQWSVSWRIATADQPPTSFAWRRASRLWYSLQRKLPFKEERILHNMADINRNVTVELNGSS